MFRGVGVWWIGINPPLTVRITGLRLTQPVTRSFIVKENENSNENSNENQDLEKGSEASPASESVMSEDKAVAKFSALRTRAQTAETEAARLQGVIEGMEKANTKAAPAVISPLDAEIARQAEEGIAEEEMTISPVIYRKQQKHEAQVRNQKAEADKATTLEATKETSRVAARALHPDWDTVINENQQYLTAGEVLDIENAGADFAVQAYQKCQAVSERLKTKTENIASNQSEEEKAAAAKLAEEVKAKEKHVPTQDEILSVVGAVDPVTDFVASL